jgi:hypothetical protein
VKSEHNQKETLTLGARCLPHQRRIGPAILTHVGLREEEAGPPDCRSVDRSTCCGGRNHGFARAFTSQGRCRAAVIAHLGHRLGGAPSPATGHHRRARKEPTPPLYRIGHRH